MDPKNFAKFGRASYTKFAMPRPPIPDWVTSACLQTLHTQLEDTS